MLCMPYVVPSLSSPQHFGFRECRISNLIGSLPDVCGVIGEASTAAALCSVLQHGSHGAALRVQQGHW